MLKRGASHLHREETTCSFKDRDASYGHSHKKRLYKDSYSSADEAPAYMR